jgi:hypothetical protein
MARTAVIAGTASATVGAVNNRAQKKAMAQQQDAAQQQQMAEMQAQLDQMQQQAAPPAPAPAPAAAAPAAAAPAAAPAPAGGDDLMAQLEKLAQLKAAGVLSEEEFTAAKAKLLGT